MFYTMLYHQYFYNYTIENWTQKETRESKLWFLCKPSVLCVIASFPRFNLIFWFFARLNTCIFALTLGMFCLIFKPEEPKWFPSLLLFLYLIQRWLSLFNSHNLKCVLCIIFLQLISFSETHSVYYKYISNNQKL